MSHFSIVDDVALRANLDMAFDHINELVVLSESVTYRSKPVQISSFRKTIIIHIGAIIEALLLWKLKNIYSGQKIQLDDEWRYQDLKVLHQISSSEEIVAGKRIKETIPLDKIDFLQLNRMCLKYKVIKTKKLSVDIDKIRKYRNKQHLGGLGVVERKYTKRILEFCFNVTERVIEDIS